MNIDQQTVMSDAQVVTATANSTNYIDTLAGHNLGSGKKVVPFIKVGTVSGTPTLTAALVGADDSGFSTNKITLATVTPTLTAGQADTLVHMAIPSHAQKRYFRMEYTVGGGSPSVVVTAGLALGEPTIPMT